MRPMNRLSQLQWLSCWDDLWLEIQKKPTWGRNQLTALMEKIEREEILRAEKEKDQ